MTEADLREIEVRPAVRPPRPSPPVQRVRYFAHWRRARRIYVEHWIAATIMLFAFANAVRLVAVG